MANPSMRKGRDGEKMGEKIITFIVATNGVASRPPNRRPTGTPHTRAKNGKYLFWKAQDFLFPEDEKISMHEINIPE